MTEQAIVVPHRWTRAEYERMVDAGTFAPGTRVELIDGEIVEMPPQKSLHSTGIRLVEEALRRAFSKGWDVRVQMPLALDERSEPEPDVAVVQGGPRDYRDAHPTSACLVVEVAEATLQFDREVKRRIYARNGISEYWLINLRDAQLEVYRDCQGNDYVTTLTLTADNRIEPLLAPGVSILVAELLA